MSFLTLDLKLVCVPTESVNFLLNSLLTLSLLSNGFLKQLLESVTDAMSL